MCIVIKFEIQTSLTNICMKITNFICQARRGLPSTNLDRKTNGPCPDFRAGESGMPPNSIPPGQPDHVLKQHVTVI